MWKKISELGDLKKLPRNTKDRRYSKKVLVSSTCMYHLDEVYLMYYDFNDNHFHFPSYSSDWRKDVRLVPVSEIDRWKCTPKIPLKKR